MAIRQETARGGAGRLQSIGTRPYWIMVAAGLAVRLLIAPWGGHPGDLATLARWASALGAQGLPAIYLTTDANYPPLALAFLALSQWGYRWLGGGELAGPLWWLLLKLPAILADMAIVLLVGRVCLFGGWGSGGRGWGNSSEEALHLEHRQNIHIYPPSPIPHPLHAYLLTASLIFNPAMIYLSAWWGQIESLTMLGALAAVLAAAARRPLLAGLSLGLGVMIKLQAAVVAPVVLLVMLLETRSARSLFRLMAGLLVPVVLAVGPYVWLGQGELVARRLVALVTGPGWPTVNALNAWYLLTGGAGNWAYNTPLAWPDSSPVIAGISARTLGASMLVAWSAVVLALTWRRMTSRDNRLSDNENAEAVRAIVPLQAGALLYLGVFLWPTQVHERYVFGAVVLLAAAVVASQAAGRKNDWSTSLYPVITLASALNLLWAAPFAPWLEGWFAGGRIAGSLIALLFITAAACGLWRMAKS